MPCAPRSAARRPSAEGIFFSPFSRCAHLISFRVRVAPQRLRHMQYLTNTRVSPPRALLCAEGMTKETSLPDDTDPPQMVVRKQGIYERGRWSTRILTIDVDAGTVTISRKRMPQDVLYRTLRIQNVTLWPHYSPHAVQNSYGSLKAKMVMCVTGTEVPLPNHGSSVGKFVRSNIESFISASITAENSAWSPNHAKQVERKDAVSKNPLLPRVSPNSSPESSTITWLIQFTSIESYELAVMLFMRFKNEDGSRRRVFSGNVTADLACVKEACRNHKARFKTGTDIDASSRSV
ncbi:hypothetical protein, unknown function [Leishmania tarentolae]|uniref:Uncharacterized protein n=1 Tax=Leishmania tarentolae TaxID=5689 RepID=A0A640KND8_LEITA|nr:hypothetical protein, unknown function [Leishmania tarentolae]